MYSQLRDRAVRRLPLPLRHSGRIQLPRQVVKVCGC
eukprot:SAG31_NODE_44722_length_261_cov_1.277778_2_plen_35_part_01